MSEKAKQIPCQSLKCYQSNQMMEHVPSLSDNMKDMYICRSCGKGASVKTKLANVIDPLRTFGLLAANVATVIAVLHGHDDHQDYGGM